MADLQEGCWELAPAMCIDSCSLMEASTEREWEWEQALALPHRLRRGNAPRGRACQARLHVYGQ